MTCTFHPPRRSTTGMPGRKQVPDNAMSQEIEATLREATKNLLYMSESDEPFDLVGCRAGSESFDVRKTLAPEKANAPVEIVTLEDFFRDLTKEEDWHGKEEKVTVERYRHLLTVIKSHLTDAKVLRVGKVNVDIFIVGRTKEGNLMGVRTKAVET